MSTSNFCPGNPSSDNSIQIKSDNVHESDIGDCDSQKLLTSHSSADDLFGEVNVCQEQHQQQQQHQQSGEGYYSDSEYMPNIPYYPESDIGDAIGTIDDDDDDGDDDDIDEDYLNRPIKEEHNMTAATESRLLDPSAYGHPHPHPHLLSHSHSQPHSHPHPFQSGTPLNAYNYPTEMSFRPPSLSMLQYTYNYSTPGRPAMGPPTAAYQSGAAAGSGYPPNFWYNNSASGFYSPPPSASVSHLHGRHMGHYPPPPPGHYGGHPHHSMHPHHMHQGAVFGGHHEQLVDMLHLSNSGREARNRAEKNRRDKLNGSIQELSTMVPHVAESPRRVDKTAVLRFSAHGLRVHYVFGQAIKKPPAVRPQLTESLMRLLDSFHITITCHGQIVLISTSVEQHLGHCQTDLYGQNVMNITHPEDQAMLRRHLIPTDLESLFDIQPEDESGEPRPRTQEEEELIDSRLKADTRSFTVRLARAGPRSEPTNYEVVRIDGSFRRSDSAPRGMKSSNFPSGLQLIRRARGRDDSIPLHSISGNDIVLVAMARLIRPPKLNSRLLEANSFEYRTRHLIDGRIIDCDQRIGLVAGYMKSEVSGLNPFTFMHQDDVRWVIVALRQMYDSKSDYGESCYRLLTRNNRFIYLQTKGYLEIDKDTNKVHSFVCINTLVSESEGRRRVQEMKKRFSLIINTQIPASSAIDIPASENPQQLEKAVLCLIQNLQKNGEDEDADASTSTAHQDYQETNSDSGQIPNIKSPIARAASSCSIRSTKTPPLALIPPEASAVKSSILKSVDVVAKNIRSGQSVHSPQSNWTPSPVSPAASRDENSNDSTSTNSSGTQNRPTVLQRNTSGITRIEEPPIKIKEEFFHSPQGRVPPLPNSSCNCYYEVGGPRSDCITCQEFAIMASPPPTAEVPVIRTEYRSGSSSVLKRTHSGMSSDSGISPSDQLGLGTEETPKRRIICHEAAGREIHQAISNSFQQIDRSLHDIENVTTELRGQCNDFTVPNTNQQLDEIFEEHQEQKKMLVNIKSEYEAHLQSSTFIQSPIDGQTPNPAEEHFTQKNDLKPR